MEHLIVITYLFPLFHSFSILCHRSHNSLLLQILTTLILYPHSLAMLYPNLFHFFPHHLLSLYFIYQYCRFLCPFLSLSYLIFPSSPYYLLPLLILTVGDWKLEEGTFWFYEIRKQSNKNGRQGLVCNAPVCFPLFLSLSHSHSHSHSTLHPCLCFLAILCSILQIYSFILASILLTSLLLLAILFTPFFFVPYHFILSYLSSLHIHLSSRQVRYFHSLLSDKNPYWSTKSIHQYYLITINKVERDREMQTHASMRSDLKIKELTDVIASQERVAIKLDKEVRFYNQFLDWMYFWVL